MNDTLYASEFMLTFALAIIGYATILFKTGDQNLLPLRAIYSVHEPEDVKHVGKITLIIGLILALIFAILTIVISQQH